MAKAATKAQNEQATAFTESFSSFSVNDLEKAKKFYSDTLSLKVNESKEGLELEFENSDTVFIYAKNDHKPATFTILNLKVPDIDAAVDDLKARGVSFEEYGGEIQTDEKGIFRGAEKSNGPNIAWFKDPAGNILSVIEEKAS
jgi:predicted enzyme related to lactoylglutathione lyase